MGVQDEHRLTREQKIGFTLLLVFSTLTILLGFIQMRQNLYTPFASKSIAQSDSTDISNLFSDEDMRLQSLDTDQDGINNYEELYQYETSPYLPDTDSDGVSDATEIANGTDPLCPEGDVCSSAADIGPTSTSTRSIIDANLAAEPLAPDLSVLEGLSPAETVSNPQQLDSIVSNPAAIRSMLLATGQFSKEQIESIDDDTLLSLVRDLMQEQSGENVPSELPSDTSPDTSESVGDNESF